jgi:phage terminase large subunit-like protein
MPTINIPTYITDWHDYVSREPDKHCKEIKLLKKSICKLLKHPKVYYSDEDVERFIDFCKILKQREGRWADLPLELTIEQKYMISCVLGFKMIDEELNIEVRYFREMVIFVARKWGKSTFIAALADYMLMLDGEAAAQVWCLATSKTQAAIVYEAAKNFLIQNDAIKKYVKTRRDKDNTEMLLFPSANSFMKAGSKLSKNQDGLNPHAYVIDECHAIRDRNTYDVFSSATGARTQPLGIIISTFGFDRDSIFDSIYTRCQKKLKGETDERLFAMIFKLDENDEVANRKCWIKANPGLGSHPTMSYLEGEYQKALNDAEQMPSFVAKNLNKFTNASFSFFDLQIINQCAKELNVLEYQDKYAVGGVDLAETTDLCCASALIPKGEELILIQKYFIAEKRIDICSKNDGKNYRAFVETNAKDLLSKNLLEITEGSFVKREYVTNWFKTLRDEYDITFLRIGYDRWHAGDWIEDMNNNGFPQCVIKMGNEITKGIMYPILTHLIRMISQPMKNTKILFEDGLVEYSKHNGLFRWCCNNTMAKTVGLDIMPDKAKSKFRIDGYASFLYAYMAYLTCAETIKEFQ